MFWLICTLLAASEPALTKATELIERAEYEHVTTALAPLLQDPNARPQLRARGEVLLGIALHNLLDEPGARLAFTRALELDREVLLPPSASPRTAELFADIRAALPEKKIVEEPPPPGVVAETPPAPWRPPLWMPLSALGAAIGVAGAGTALMISGSNGRADAAVIEDAVRAQERFEDANTNFRLGSGLAIASTAILAGALVLFVWPFSEETE